MTNFSLATLEVDKALWGSFWQGDVIAPGYTVPLLELWYLRVTRLEQSFTVKSPEHYLEVLQTTLLTPPDGLWLTHLNGNMVVCVAFKQQNNNKFLIIWLLNGLIIAAYQDIFINAPGYNLLEIKPLSTAPHTPPTLSPHQKHLLKALSEQLPTWQAEWLSLDEMTQLDRLIQIQRVCGYKNIAKLT